MWFRLNSKHTDVKTNELESWKRDSTERMQHRPGGVCYYSNWRLATFSSRNFWGMLSSDAGAKPRAFVKIKVDNGAFQNSWTRVLIVHWSCLGPLLIMRYFKLPAVQFSIGCQGVRFKCQSGAALLFVFLRTRAVWLVHVRADHETGGFFRA